MNTSEETAVNQRRDWQLKLVVFIAGAVLMGLEMTGSRVLAIHFGSSIYVWAPRRWKETSSGRSCSGPGSFRNLGRHYRSECGKRPPPVGIDLIFFDGEDFGRGEQWDDYFLGSKAWMRDHPDYRPARGVVLDMVGDAELEIKKERNSLASAPQIVERVWNAALRVGASAIVNKTGGRILDDQIAFLEKGIPVVLLIDFSYPWFHTTGDTVDKCSPESLGQVGRTVMEAVAAMSDTL